MARACRADGSLSSAVVTVTVHAGKRGRFYGRTRVGRRKSRGVRISLLALSPSSSRNGMGTSTSEVSSKSRRRHLCSVPSIRFLFVLIEIGDRILHFPKQRYSSVRRQINLRIGRSFSSGDDRSGRCSMFSPLRPMTIARSVSSDLQTFQT